MNVTDKQRKSYGNAGEDYVADHLIKQGYSIVKRNYHSRYGEVDIIAADGKYIIFVEVKTRHENPMYRPALAVTKAKQNKIIKTAVVYMTQSKCKLQPRFDVAEVLLQYDSQQVTEMNYFAAAFIQGGSDYAAF